MSLHNSLKTKKFGTNRSVRKRYERLEKLNRNMKWIEGMSVYGLPKEKIEIIKLKIKDEKKEITESPILPFITSKDKKKKISKDVGNIK